MDGFEADPLTCTAGDSSWSVQLPPVTQEDIGLIKVELVDSSPHASLFMLSEGVLSLSSNATESFDPRTCPYSEKTQIDFNFKLSSELLGDSE